MKKDKKKQERVYNPEFSYNQKSHYSDYLHSREEYFEKNPSTVVEEYNKEVKKKPKRLARWIRNVLVIVSIAIFAITIVSVGYVLAGQGGSGYKEKGVENVHNFHSLEVAPVLTDPVKVDLSEYKTAKGKTRYLYDLASKNATDTPWYAAYNTGLLYMKMGSSENYMDIDAVTLKSQQEYFNIEYHLKNSVPILDSILGEMLASATDVITTERRYVSVNDSYMTYQKVRNNEYDEKGVPKATWDATIAINTPLIKELPIPTFHSAQEGVYRITNHVITEETASDAEVIYNEEEGYYDVTVTLDHTNPKTYVQSINDIRAGTGDNNAKYNFVKMHFTVWDTGYFRTFSMTEKWSAKVVLSLDFELQTNWKMSYDKRDCNIAQYPDAKAFLETKK